MPTGSGVVGQARPRLGVNSFQHRFGSPFNRHVHLHDCVSDRVFEQGVDGVFTPDHPLRPPVTTMAIGNQPFLPLPLGEGQGEGAPEQFCRGAPDHPLPTGARPCRRILLSRHLVDRLGEAAALGGRSVSAGLTQLRR